MLLGLLSILLLIFGTSFFVASEYSIISVRKTRIQQLIGEGRGGAKEVGNALDHLDRFIAAIQIGVTMASLGLGALGEPVLAQIFIPWFETFLPEGEALLSAHGIAIAMAFLIVTILEIVLGEVVPKILARQKAEATALFLIRPLNLFVTLFRPIIWLVTFMSNLVLRVIGLRPDAEHTGVYSVEELEMLVTSSRKAGVLDRDEEVILRRVFDFGEITARQVMRPRTEIAAIPVTASLEEVMQAVVEHKHTRFPVYDENLDNIVGILYAQDLLEAIALAAGYGQSDSTEPAQDQGMPFDLRAIVRPPKIMPETMDVADLLPQMQKSGVQMVVVIDEYGGTAGIVTLEDIIEEIVGEVRDEFEPESASSSGINVTPDGTLIEGMVDIDEVNDVLDLGIRSEADTIGGYVFEMIGRKPELGDEVRHNGHIFRVEQLDGLRIAQVRVLSRKGPEPTSEEDEE